MAQASLPITSQVKEDVLIVFKVRDFIGLPHSIPPHSITHKVGPHFFKKKNGLCAIVVELNCAGKGIRRWTLARHVLHHLRQNSSS